MATRCIRREGGRTRRRGPDRRSTQRAGEPDEEIARIAGGEIPAGRNLALLLSRMRDAAPIRSFAAWAAAHQASRIDIGDVTRRLSLLTLAETGMRVGELHSLEWRDVDVDGARFRVRDGKSAARAGGSPSRWSL